MTSVTASTSHVAVLLAAGASTRLGQPKQLLARNGEPLVRAIARALAATQPIELIVVLGAQARAVGEALGDLRHRAVINPDFADGLSTSLRCAADALSASNARVLIAACDQPALEASHLDRLLAAAQGSPAQCAATMHGERLGIPAVVPAIVFRQCRDLRGDGGLGDWLSATEGVARVDAPELAFDVDTPADLEQARQRGLLD